MSPWIYRRGQKPGAVRRAGDGHSSQLLQWTMRRLIETPLQLEVTDGKKHYFFLKGRWSTCVWKCTP